MSKIIHFDTAEDVLTAKELIDALSKLPPDAKVIVALDEDEHCNCTMAYLDRLFVGKNGGILLGYTTA